MKRILLATAVASAITVPVAEARVDGGGLREMEVASVRFNNRNFKVKRETVRENGTVTVRGVDRENRRVVLNYNRSGEIVSGMVEEPDGNNYTITSDGEMHKISRATQGHSDIRVSDHLVSAPLELNPVVATTDNRVAVIDLVVFIDSGIPGTDEVAYAQAEIDNVNEIFRTSGVHVYFNVVDIIPRNIPYTMSNDDILQAATLGQDVFYDVHAIREGLNADMVTVIAMDNRYRGDCGLGWMNGANGRGLYDYSESQDAENSFTSVASCTGDGRATAHEIGHNMGLAHDRSNANAMPHKDYGWGYYYNTPTSPTYNTTYGTVMAYPGVQQYVFSNPDLTCEGDHACGTQSENATRALNDVRFYYSGVRGDVTYGDNTVDVGDGDVGGTPYIGGVYSVIHGSSCKTWNVKPNQPSVEWTGAGIQVRNLGTRQVVQCGLQTPVNVDTSGRTDDTVQIVQAVITNTAPGSTDVTCTLGNYRAGRGVGSQETITETLQLGETRLVTFPALNTPWGNLHTDKTVSTNMQCQGSQFQVNQVMYEVH